MKAPPVSFRKRTDNDVPPAAFAVAEKRMADFVKMFGYVHACGGGMDLLTFATSCYLQGCEDMALAALRNRTETADHD